MDDQKTTSVKSVVRPTMALSGYNELRIRNKRIIIGLLVLALLSIMTISLVYALSRTEPLPKIAQPGKGQAIAPPAFLFAITGGPGDLALKKPLDVAIHPNGTIYVTTFTNKTGTGRIEAFGRNGTFLFSFDQLDGDNRLKAPNYIAVSPAGDIFVSDKAYGAVFVFNADGTFKKRFVPDNNAKFAWVPTAIAFDAAGKMYVTDVGDVHRVLVFGRNGKLALQFGATGMITKQGQMPGKFYFPNGVVIDRDNKIYVADSNNRRVQVFSETGKYERTIETAGLPRGIALDSRDRLYVVDALGHDVSVFKKTTASGPALTVYGGQGIQLGQMLYPNGLKLDDSGQRSYVADRENNRVDVFEWPDNEQSAVASVKKVVPLAGLAIPPFLLFWGLVARRRRFFADRGFLDNIVRHHHLAALQRKAKKVYVTPESFEFFKGYQEGDIKAQDVLVSVDPDETTVTAMKQKHRLGHETALLFAGAHKGITKARIMAEADEAHLTALDLDMESMDHDLFMEYYDVDKAGEGQDASSDD